MTFKPGTDDLRESPIVELVEILSGKGLRVKIYDDNVALSKLVGGNKAFIEKVLPHISALMCDSLEEVVQEAGVVVVAHSLADGGLQLLNLLQPDQLVVDLVKLPLLDSHCLAACEGICW